MNLNWLGKLQVTLVFAFIFWKKLSSHTFKASSEEAPKQPSEVFLRILQNSQENTCVRVSFLIKSQAWGLQFY